MPLSQHSTILATEDATVLYGQTEPTRAVVIGGSMAGLMAARVLSDHFEQVIVLDKDELPLTAQPRRGAPQSIHTHGLLSRGANAMEALFPGFKQSLIDQGGLRINMQANFPIYSEGKPLAHGQSETEGVGASRLCIEAELRRRVRAIDNVLVFPNQDITQPRYDEDLKAVTGVEFYPRALQGNLDPDLRNLTLSIPNNCFYLRADLVVDATGRGSQSPKWLSNWGFKTPTEERVRVGIAYITAYFKRDPHNPMLDGSWPSPINGVLSTASPAVPRPGVMLAQEPDVDGNYRWVISFGGYEDDQPEPNHESFIACAKQVGSHAMLKVVQQCEQLGEIHRYQFPYNMRRHYEKLRNFPARYLVMGDALASFNPIYGQGMTVAASEAQLLQQLLAQSEKQLWQPFFKAAAKLIDTPWQMAVGADLAIPSVAEQEKAPLSVKIINRYMARLFQAAHHNSDLSRAFIYVMHMLKPPTSLFAPKVLWRVWRKMPRTNEIAVTPKTMPEGAV